jgi:folate-binding protein YgfZ
MIKTPFTVHEYRPAAAIKVSGEDAFSFLQGQFTNELRQREGSASYGLWLNQKGKVLADSFVLSLGQKEFFIVSTASFAEIILKRLEGYIVADDVVLFDESAAFHGLALWDAGSTEKISDLFGAAPVRGEFLQRDGAFIFHGRRTKADSYEIIGPHAVVTAWKQKLLSAGGEISNTDGAERARMVAGIPAVPADIGASDLPNEGGLEESAISYTKGCYLGQEVMARLKNLGQVRRGLQVVRGSGEIPKSGAALFQGEKKAGEFRSVVTTENGFIGFAMLTRLGIDPGVGFTLEPTASAGEKAAIWMNSHS